MNASHISEAITVMEQAYEFINEKVPPGTPNKVDLACRVYKSICDLNAELSLIKIEVLPAG